MSILTDCKNCGKKYRFDDEYQGKRVRCRNCGSGIRVPLGRESDPWDEPVQAAEIVRNPKHRKKKKKRKKTGNKAVIFVSLLMGITLVVGAIAGIANWAGSRDDDAESESGPKGGSDRLRGDPNRRFPSFPYAVSSLPKAITGNAPFDVDEYFYVPTETENAAPLYLDAMFEFSASLKDFVSPAEVKKRERITEKREKQFDAFWPLRSKRPIGIDAKRIDAILAEFEPGFKNCNRHRVARSVCLRQKSVRTRLHPTR